MEARSWRVFLDSSVLVAGILSPTGASAAILDLGEAEEIIIIISQEVLVETDRVVERKFPDHIDFFREFIANLSPFVVENPSTEQVRDAGNIIHKDDAPILAAAGNEDIHFLVSLDTKHFHTKKVREYLKCPIVTPAQFLKEFRKIFEDRGGEE